jgi:hypothetical protein
MLGYPITYGDDFESGVDFGKHGLTLSKIAFVALFCTVLTGSSVSAVEPAIKVVAKGSSTEAVSKATTGAVCMAAGSACTSLGKTPKMKAAIACAVFFTWCAAKYSPI